MHLLYSVCQSKLASYVTSSLVYFCHTSSLQKHSRLATLFICLERSADLHMAQLMPLPLITVLQKQYCTILVVFLNNQFINVTHSLHSMITILQLAVTEVNISVIFIMFVFINQNMRFL